MLRFMLVVSCLVALACSSDPVEAPTAKEIQLIRESWKTVKENQNIPTRALIELFKAHPKIQKLSPKYGGLSLNELPKNIDFLRSAHLYYVFALDFVVDCLDDEDLLRDQLQRVDTYGKWYVDYVPKVPQVIESVRLYLVALYAEEPNMSQETKGAWAKGLYYAFSFMGVDAPSPTSGTSVLSPAEIKILRQSYEKVSRNINIPAKTIIKLFALHPGYKKSIPSVADIPIEELTVDHPILRGYALSFAIVLHYFTMNIDNDELLTRVLAKRTRDKPLYFATYIEANLQLDEWTRLFLEAAEEEKLCSIEQEVWKKVFDHAHEIMVANAPKNVRKPRKLNVPSLSGKVRGLIRDSWGLARRNADLAPDTLLRFIHVHPETKNLFPRLGSVSRAELPTNRVFLQASYNCYFGITWIVKNLDDMELIAEQMWKHTSPAWFTTEKPTNRDQLTETTRIFLEVLKEKLGDALTEEQVQAWQELFTTVYEVMINNLEEPLSEDDWNVLRDTWGIAKQNPRFGSNAFLKFLKAHPAAQSYLPMFNTIPISQLADNREFIAYGKILNDGITSIIENLENKAWFDERFIGSKLNQYYAPNIPAHVQDQETTRILVDALDEELGPRFTKTTRDVWTRAIRRFNTLFAEYVA